MTEATAPDRPAHTPGPWTTHYDHPDLSTIAYVRAVGPPDDEIAVCYGFSSDEEDRANARLIAAAPDLLAALEGLLTALPSATTHPAIKVARAAIARATGDAS